MAIHQSKARVGRFVEDWMDDRHKSGSYRILARDGWPDYLFAFHDQETIGPRMLSRIAKHTGLTPDDL